MPFDRQLHHFEAIDAGSFPSACAAFLRQPPEIHKLFLFGKYIGDKIKIYIVNDVRDLHLSVQRGWTIIVTDGKCYSFDTFFLFLDGGYKKYNPKSMSVEFVVKVDNSVLSALFKDGISRHIDAFGGKERFFEWLDFPVGCKGGPMLCGDDYHEYPQFLQTILDEYR